MSLQGRLTHSVPDLLSVVLSARTSFLLWWKGLCLDSEGYLVQASDNLSSICVLLWIRNIASQCLHFIWIQIKSRKHFHLSAFTAIISANLSFANFICSCSWFSSCTLKTLQLEVCLPQHWYNALSTSQKVPKVGKKRKSNHGLCG